MLEYWGSWNRNAVILTIGVLQMLSQLHVVDAGSNVTLPSYRSSATESPSAIDSPSATVSPSVSLIISSDSMNAYNTVSNSPPVSMTTSSDSSYVYIEVSNFQSASKTESYDSIYVYSTVLNDISPTPSFTDASSTELLTSPIIQSSSESISDATRYVTKQYTSYDVAGSTNSITDMTSTISLYQQSMQLTSSLRGNYFSEYTDSIIKYSESYSSVSIDTKSYSPISAIITPSAVPVTTAIIPSSASDIFPQISSVLLQSTTSSSVYAIYSSSSSQNVLNNKFTTTTLTMSSVSAPYIFKLATNMYPTTVPLQNSTTSQLIYYSKSSGIMSPSTSELSTTELVSTDSVSLTTVTQTTSSASVAASISMVIKPPPLRPITKPAVSLQLQGCKTGSCCTYGLSQLPARVNFEESERRGYVMAEIRDIVNVSFAVQVARPRELATLLKDSFNITTTRNGYKLVLSQAIDLEELYDKTDGKLDVHSLQVQISCTENSSIIVPPRMLNVTIEDVDDNMPVFRQPGTDSGDCVVPVYKADTSEDYMGELALSPGKIQAVDGDVSSRHNISYRVLHSEPADYHVYFSLDTDNGTVHKTKTMNSSDPNKYVIFVQAVEDSPQQKSRVAVLSIYVVAPNDPFSNPNQANPTARLALKIACLFILMAFICGVVVIVHHRYTRSRRKVSSWQKDEARDMKLPKLAVYQSSSSSLNSAMPEIPDISSPSQIVVASDNTLKPEPRESESQKKRRLIVKKPLDTKLRPGWNAPPPRPKKTRYNPFSVYQTQHAR